MKKKRTKLREFLGSPVVKIPRTPCFHCSGGWIKSLVKGTKIPHTVLLLLLSHFSHVRLCATHRRQPTRLPCPWDSPGKNTGVGCHFLLPCRKVKSESEVAQSCPPLSDPMDCSPPGPSIPGIFQARVLEWGAIAFSDSQKKRVGLRFAAHGW